MEFEQSFEGLDLRHEAIQLALIHYNMPGDSGYTPLHYAARAGHLDAVCLLLDAGKSSVFPTNTLHQEDTFSLKLQQTPLSESHGSNVLYDNWDILLTRKLSVKALYSF